MRTTSKSGGSFFLALLALFATAACEASGTSDRQKTMAVSEEAIGFDEKANAQLCISRTNQGCCSSNVGLKGILTDQTFVCENSNLSATCKSKIDFKVQGCCSGDYEGVDYVDYETGRVRCEDGEFSPTCHFDICDTRKRRS